MTFSSAYSRRIFQSWNFSWLVKFRLMSQTSQPIRLHVVWGRRGGGKRDWGCDLISEWIMRKFTHLVACNIFLYQCCNVAKNNSLVIFRKFTARRCDVPLACSHVARAARIRRMFCHQNFSERETTSLSLIISSLITYNNYKFLIIISWLNDVMLCGSAAFSSI